MPLTKPSPIVAALAAAVAFALVTLASPGGTASPARESPETDKPVVLAFAGDIHFEGILSSKLAAAPSQVLAPIRPVLQRADIAVVNLETAVTRRGSAQPKEYVFRAPPTAFAALEGAGADVASMANNHGMDYGERGLRDSLAAAKRYRFPVIGIGLDGKRAYAPLRRTIRGQRIAVIGATQVLDDHLIDAWTAGPGKPGLASAKDVPRLLQEVRRARRTADTLVVFLHWGVELEQCPTRVQRTLARQLVTAGADVVVGGHSHRLLGTGRLGDALVSYGLGNFAWYATSGPSTQTGVLFVTVTGRRIGGYRWEPARIIDGVPRPLAGAAEQQAVSSWRRLRGCAGLKP